VKKQTSKLSNSLKNPATKSKVEDDEDYAYAEDCFDGEEETSKENVGRANFSLDSGSVGNSSTPLHTVDKDSSKGKQPQMSKMSFDSKKKSDQPAFVGANR